MKITQVIAGLCVAFAAAIAWAGYEPFDKLTPEAQQQLINDWTFQASGEFTAQKVADEIKWAKEAADRIGKMADAPNLSAKVAALDELQKKLDASAEQDFKALYFEVRIVKRDILFSNPLLDSIPF